VYPELRALVAKTVGAILVLRSALSKISGNIAVAFVYGSIARRQERAESDIDLMVIGTATLEDVLGAVSGVEPAIGRPVNPNVYPVVEFRNKLAHGNHFLTSVLSGEKIFLVGDEDELRKVGGVRVAKSRPSEPR
jgi:predicted nucleotidyltransferase